MIKIILTLFVIVSSASFINAQTASNPIVTAVCNFIQNKPVLQNTIVKNLNSLSTNSAVTKKFPNSVAYVTLAQNQNNLKAGGSQCQSFFAGLQIAFGQDAQADNLTPEQLQQQFTTFITTYFPLLG